MAWIDAVRTTHYSLILMLRCDVFTFVVKQEVPNDEDVEWLYTSCLFYEKSFLELFARLQTRDISDMSSNLFTWRWQFFLLAGIGSNNMFWSNFFFYICYHGGGSTKHFRRPKVKRRDEESSPSDALTPKIKKTRLTGKMRTYLWACPLIPGPPTLRTYYPLFFHLDVLLCCLHVFSQARSSQRRRFRVALPKLLIVWKIVF